jgi:4'-phosphopantetheinyl transferase EntD
VLLAVERVGDDEAGLLPEEARQVASAVPRRRREFAAGRLCARSLLRRLGETPLALLSGRDRAPIWPEDVVGSISHSAARVAVAVARRGAIAGLGVDIEPDRVLERSLWDEVLTAAEIEELQCSEAPEQGRRARLFFSAKEAVYKCLHAFAPRALDFRDVEISLHGGVLSARLPSDVRAALPPRSRLTIGSSRQRAWTLIGATLEAVDPQATLRAPIARLGRSS